MVTTKVQAVTEDATWSELIMKPPWERLGETLNNDEGDAAAARDPTPQVFFQASSQTLE